MIVKMKTNASGPNINVMAGQLADVSEETGKAFIDGGFAELAEPEKKEVKPVAPKAPHVVKEKTDEEFDVTVHPHAHPHAAAHPAHAHAPVKEKTEKK